MNYPNALRYFANCFLLLIPVLVFNLVFMHQLPSAYQMDVFWKGIPKAVGIPENVMRILVMVLPVFMRLRISTPSQQLGFGLYTAGLLVYFASWTVLIVSPQSAWSASAIGFMAPAFTPILWLAGIGMIGDEFQTSQVPFKWWMYWIVSACFLFFHILHTGLVYARAT